MQSEDQEQTEQVQDQNEHQEQPQTKHEQYQNERKKKARKKWELKNKEERQEYHRQYYQKNKEHLKAKQRAYTRRLNTEYKKRRFVMELDDMTDEQITESMFMNLIRAGLTVRQACEQITETDPEKARVVFIQLWDQTAYEDKDEIQELITGTYLNPLFFSKKDLLNSYIKKEDEKEENTENGSVTDTQTKLD